MLPDMIERTILLRHPVERVWQALTTADGLAGDLARAAHKGNSEGWDAELADLVAYLDAG